ncbi:PIG-L deacetylase family protein [Thermoflexibacter ruber]|uniref:N-acetylglucosaminyl deacetylase, LmbE family n=1 Tax=Thermoflexibacter ruber TaxID=1003 RepID=A0A1I2D0I0_9BACT|nr:PIG-L deacetylase family protein [Thermoflexibacter ruber]SFE74036.1 N-acetylglucosaminyl deacetylase, LmbE family [Thermoflexibacter ruber]
MIKKILLSLVLLLLLVVIILAAGLFFVKNKLNKTANPITVYENFPLEEGKHTIMCLFAHPDDEISIAGTLCQLSQNPQNQIIGIYLTRGEAGGTGGLVPQEQLGEERTKELENLAKVVGYKHLEILGFPDGKLNQAEVDTVKMRILEAIYRYRPDIMISFDDRVGLYGHPDHLLAGKWAKQICEENMKNDSFPIQKLYCPTLSQGMIEIALSIAETFKRNYPQDPEKGLPPASFAVNISSVGECKLQAIQAHRTQKRTFTDVFPLYDQVPPFWYFRLFDKEYFTLQVEK